MRVKMVIIPECFYQNKQPIMLVIGACLISLFSVLPFLFTIRSTPYSTSHCPLLLPSQFVEIMYVDSIQWHQRPGTDYRVR